MEKKITDYFSSLAQVYAQFRPSYPEAMFDYFAGLVKSRGRAWDCGTGSGQAAIALAKRFDRVIATDASQGQIDHATKHPKVEYVLSKAESCPAIADRSIDLVTVANALHWFDRDLFFAEVKRVLKPGGVLAVWGTNYERNTGPVEHVMRRYMTEIVEKYVPEEIKTGYRNLAFPFDEVTVPEFVIELEWTDQEVLGFLNSLAATHRYITDHGKNPIDAVKDEIVAIVKERGGKVERRLKINLRVGLVR